MKTEISNRPKRQYIHDLGPKLAYLCRLCGDIAGKMPADEAALARLIGLSPSYFSKTKNGHEGHENLLVLTAQERLAQVFGFDVDWPEWRAEETYGYPTKGETRKDSATRFIERFERETREPRTGVTPLPLLATSTQFGLDFAFRFKLQAEATPDTPRSYKLVVFFDEQPLYEAGEYLGDVGLSGVHLSIQSKSVSDIIVSSFAREKISSHSVEVYEFGDDESPGWWVKSKENGVLRNSITLGDEFLFSLDGMKPGRELKLNAVCFEKQFQFSPGSDFRRPFREEDGEGNTTAMMKQIVENLVETELKVGLSKKYYIGEACYRVPTSGENV